jgi:UDP-glucose 4-epimerase
MKKLADDGLAGARVAITGGDGFLGRHLVAALSGRGARVLVVDDGRVEQAPMLPPPEYDRVWRDFRDPEALDAVAAFAPEVVFHLAAMHFVPDCDRDPTACLATNVLGTERLLASLRQVPVEAIVFCSSAVVYGFSDAPRTEDDELSPQHIYAHSKWLGEGLLRGFHADRPDVRTVSARLFNLIGPGDTARHVIPEIVDAVTAGRELLLGNVWPRRDYVHVADVAAALCALAVGPAESTALNVGTGVGRSVADVLEAVAAIVGREPRVVRDPGRERATDGHLVADVSRITASTSWRPRWALEDTMRQLLGDAGAR